MKTALIFFRNAENKYDAQYYQKVIARFENCGIKPCAIEVLSDSDDLGFKRRLEEFKDKADNLVVFDNQRLSFDIKSLIAQNTDTALAENETARKILDDLGETDDYFALMPIEATVVPNLNGAYQGFIFDANEFTLALLPIESTLPDSMLEKYVLPYLQNKSGEKRKRLTLKYFGDGETLYSVLDEARESCKNDLIYTAEEDCGDFTVSLNYKGDANCLEAVRLIIGKLKDNIYAEFDTTLSERLFDLLRLKKLKISVSESFTGGRIVASLISNSGASEFVHEGVVSYSNFSKVKRLGVLDTDLKKHGAVSSVVAYQMAAGLIKDGNSDIAISTTGIAGPKSDDTEKPVGLCYIGVGMRDGVHTYRFNLKGDREKITETAKNTALFLAIKKLKSI